ncbi:MAG: M48 family metalloprotease [Polyangiaceae bacterium]
MKPRTSLTSRIARGTAAALTALSLVAATGCSSTPRQGNTAGQWQGQGAFGGQQNQNGYGTNPNAVVQQNLPPVMNDPINNMDFAWMRQRAAIMLNELVTNLNPQQRAKVEGIPLVSDDEPGEVNAYAGCRQGAAFMATTDGLLEVVAYSARARATDEVFQTRKLDAYVSMVAQGAGNGPLPRPQMGFFDPSQDVDGRKVLRQNVLFDAQLGFVLGHELGHHYLGHTGCANGASTGITIGDIGRVISNKIPVMNQPNEATADQAGTYNLLAVGSHRPQGQQFNEEGALLVLNFFLALHGAGGGNSILAVFESTHPHPSVRIPLVQNAANTWRQTGGNPPPVFSY